MEFETNKSNNIDDNQSQNSNVDIKELIIKYSRFWKWFILSVVITLFISYYNLNFERPLYQIQSSLKIKSEKGGDRSTLSVFQDLGIGAGTKDNIEDEIEIIQSKSLISEAIKALKLNVTFYTDKTKTSSFVDDNLGLRTNFYKNERYSNPPLKLNFFISDSALYRINSKFIVHINSLTQFTYKDIKTSIEIKHSFGEKISTNFGSFIITPNIDLKKNNLIGSSVLVSITPVENLTNSYLSRLTVEPVSQYSSVLSLTLTDTDKRKGEDFLNELIKKYNHRAVTLKEKMTKTTSDFVNERLNIISNELSNVDLSAESIKTKYRISDAASQTGLNLESVQQLEQQIVNANTQLKKIEFIKDFVSDKDDNELIPDLDVGDENSSAFKQQYNELMLEKQRLLKTSTEKNPTVVNINEQLIALKNNFQKSINNLESSQKITLNALEKQDSRINSRLYAAPKQERQYRDIQREQQIKESLYLYLLQKREETAITLGVAEPNAEVIDYAQSLPDPVAPKKMLAYLGAIIFGLLIPFIIIYLIDLLDSKIHTKEDVEKILDVPIIGDIPKFDSKKRYIISKDDYSSVAEAFRILRTNLKFILPNSSDEFGKTVFVTSTIAHEGKSLVSTNLATALAFAGKKTLILGLDIRAPKIEPYLKVRSDKGITNYVIDHTLEIDEITVNVPNVRDLDVIFSGDLAPNPSELLMNKRINNLFEYARKHYEYIIVDTAAFSMVTDTMLLSSFSDAFIYVIRANFLDKRALKYIRSLHKEKRLNNMAILLNGVDHKKAYGYGYGYGYGSEFEKSKKKPWWKFS